MPRGAAVAGRVLADTALLAWSLLVTTAIGFAVGFRLHAGVASAVAAFGLCVVYGFAFSWLFITLGLMAGNAQAAQGMALLVFPLTFVSSAYVPVAPCPAGCGRSPDNQPITLMVDAVRVAHRGARRPRPARPLRDLLRHRVAVVVCGPGRGLRPARRPPLPPRLTPGLWRWRGARCKARS